MRSLVAQNENREIPPHQQIDHRRRDAQDDAARIQRLRDAR